MFHLSEKRYFQGNQTLVFRGCSRGQRSHMVDIAADEKLLQPMGYLSTFKGVPKWFCFRVSIKPHPLGFNWHRFEGPGHNIYMVTIGYQPPVVRLGNRGWDMTSGYRTPDRPRGFIRQGF